MTERKITMGKIILFSPVGGTDPISVANKKDGSLLHICRWYKPDEVILYMSAEIMENHKKDNRYIYCLEKLSELINKKMEYRFIERPELTEVQDFNFFYNEFREILKQTYKQMNKGDKLLLNVSSGTPAMKSALLGISNLGELPFKAIQVTTPDESMNKVRNIDTKDYAKLWEENVDNIEPKNRCKEIKCQALLVIKNEEIIKKHIKVYDYRAACDAAESIDDEYTKSYKKLLYLAKARLSLDFNEVDKLSKITKFDCTPIKDNETRQLYEYALGLDIKLKKGEYADFVRGITPVVADLFELMLRKRFKIDINDYITMDDSIPPVRRWDINKLRGSKVESILNKSGKFKSNSPVYSSALAEILLDFSYDEKLKTAIKNIRKVEGRVRNIAAHEVISVSNESIKELSGFSGTQIMMFIKDLFMYANLGVTNEMWDSYNEMNSRIINIIDNK